MVFKEIVSNWKWNTFYSVLTFGGFLILMFGMSGNDLMLKFGFVTFAYGILSWMLCNGFYIKAKFTLPPPSIDDLMLRRKKTDWVKLITIAVGMIHICLFIAYVIIASIFLFGKN